MTLERDGEDVPIAPRAFDALLLLIQSRGQVVSKAELLSSIWPDTHVEEANLPVMISAIRRATGDDGRHQKYIQTVSKSGYRFVGEVKEISLAEVEVDLKSRFPAIFRGLIYYSSRETQWEDRLASALEATGFLGGVF